jgi:hypothetical protein
MSTWRKFDVTLNDGAVHRIRSHDLLFPEDSKSGKYAFVDFGGEELVAFADNEIKKIIETHENGALSQCK